MPTKSTNLPLSPLVVFILTILAGTLGWEVLVSILALGGLQLNLSTGPVGFDVKVISFYMEVNPGTFLGLYLGYRFARSVAGSAGRSRKPGGSRSPRSRKSSGSGGGANSSGARGKPASGDGGSGGKGE